MLLRKVDTTKRPGFTLKCTTLALLLIVALVGSVSLAAGCSSEPEEDPLETLRRNYEFYMSYRSGMWIPPPKSLAEVADNADVIVIGKVDSLFTPESLERYDEANRIRIEAWWDSAKPNPPSFPPYSNYLIDVEKVILDDGTLESGYPLLIVLPRRPGHRKDDPPDFRTVPDFGERRLFPLALNPDERTYSWESSWHYFIIDGDTVTYPDDLRTPIGFTDKRRPAEFIKALEQAVEDRNG